MSQCLRCSKPCETSAVFCDECRSLLRNEFRRGSISHSSDSENAASVSASSLELASFPTSPLSFSVPSLVAQKQERPGGDLVDQDTKQPAIVETPRVSNAPITPHPPTMNSYTYPESADQTMSRLSEAAQLIAEVEPSNRRLPRASRLAPIRDISADIRRESTPLPKFAKMRSNTDASEKVGASGSLPAQPDDKPVRSRFDDGEMPDLWPWLDNEVEEKENEDSWANSTDPLISRHIPNSAEAARIEEEDIKRAPAEGMPTSHNLHLVRVRRPFSLRMAFVVLALLAVIALIVDSVLLSVVVTHPRRATTTSNGPAVPALTLSPNMVRVYDALKRPIQVPVQVSIMNFPPDHTVQLTHDVQEAVTMARGSSTVTIPRDGSAKVTIKVTMLVDDTWSVGFDQVYAEDVATHYTASAQLQVVGKASSSPAHLGLFDQTGKQPVKSLDFGSVPLGLDSIQQLMLENNSGNGSGSITWSAGSDQPWLLVSPDQGTFSQSQKIDVAVQTLNLKQGIHMGTLTLSSNVSTQPLIFQVRLNVSSPGSGAVLAITPAVLSFTTTDGSQTRPSQILTLDNPSNQPLSWMLAIPVLITTSNQAALERVAGISNKWLSATPDTGSVPAHSSQQIVVSVNSNSLLPGAYQGELLFSAPGTNIPTQIVGVSLTEQPHCGLVTNSGNLTFTAVQGKTNPSNQSLGLNATASCAGAPLNWKTTLSSSYNWLNATPSSGVLKGTTSEYISVGADAAGLPAGTYYGFMAFTTANSTQTVMVQLTVQPQPAPGAPILSAAPLNLNFSSTSAQPNPPGQVVTITNSGGSPLKWYTNVNIIVASWLNAAPTNGVIQPGQTGQLVVKIDTSGLSPGSYAGQITINAQAPASGGGEVVSVNLVVQPPCTLTQPSSTSLAFSGVQGGTNPIAPTLLITGTGNCAWPLTLTPGKTSAPWLSVNFPTGNKINANGQSIPFVVGASTLGLTSGPPLSASFTISATDSAGTVATNSPQQITATLSVLPPCVAAPVTNLTFTAAQGQPSPKSMTVLLKESGTCSRPVTWTATTTTSWLSLSTPAPDTGTGTSLTVAVNSTSLPAGPVTGTFMLTAIDNSGAIVGSQTITVTVNVAPTYSVSGTVLACQPGPAPLCTTSAPLPGASLTLFDSTNMQVQIVTADASGNYAFTNLLPGTYSVTITGTDSSNVTYSTSGIPLVVTVSATNVTLKVYPG